MKKRKINDVWHLYRYGRRLKAVYVKIAVVREKEDEALFSEYADLPPDLRALAIYGAVYNGFPVRAEKSAEGEGRKRQEEKAEDEDGKRLAASISRTKARIYEYALCNEFQYFCTFTQAPSKVKDRYDLDQFRKDFAHWVRNQNRSRSVPIRYLLIPEQHKDGAWHLHGFVDGLQVGADLREFSLSERLPVGIRKVLQRGEKVYNWEKYSNKFGFFTASPIKSREKAAAYVTKYVTKDVATQSREAGRHLFFASQGLKKREVIFKNGVDDNNEVIRCPFEEWDFENEYVKVKWIDNY